MLVNPIHCSSKIPAVLYLALALLLSACGGGGGGGSTPALKSITVTPPSPIIVLGAKDQFAATGTYTDNTNQNITNSVTWSSSNTAVATIGNSGAAEGLATSVAVGATTITATLGAITGSTTLTVATVSFAFGPEETVFSYATDACDALDVPDNPAHFIRLPDGSLFMDDGDAPNYFGSFGSGFSTLHRDCSAPILVSDDLPSADTFDNYEWVESAYMAGGVIHGLIHNEFHDPIATDCKPGDSSPANPCWYNSITYGVSTDGGHKFTHAAPPGQLLAPPPQQWDSTGPPSPYGYFEPSGIVLAQDAFYYAIFRATPKNGSPALCVMRTQTLDDPTSWRAWDGSGFNLQMTDPYTSSPAICSGVAPDVAQPTVAFNTYLGKYLLVGSAVLGNPPVCGAAYALSPDLIHWSDFQIMRSAYFSFAPCLPPGGVGYLNVYFSVIDHDDTTTNFEKSGQTPYLYYTKQVWNNGGTLSRDLVRVPMTISLH